MIRKMDLVRAIALFVESMSDARMASGMRLPGFSEAEVIYHVQLMAEAGLLLLGSAASEVPGDKLVVRLTWAGHEFVDMARDDKTWKATTSRVASTVASVGMDVLKTLLQHAALRACELD
ncbi:MAG TPA: DUF2513 domain-containing protein [Pirellulaceae bacterium]|nr:DUF2513 domain-containing protein [Pirellulaceae bacterium]